MFNFKRIAWYIYSLLSNSSSRRVFDKLLSHGVYQKCFKEKKCIFIHVPKAAGTSLSMSIYGKKVGHLKVEDFIREGIDLDNFFVFTFSRNPYLRLYSTYEFLKKGGTADVSVSKRNQDRVLGFSSFSEFVADLYKREKSDYYDITLTPQVDFIKCNDKYFELNYIGKYENIDTDFEKLKKIIDFDCELSSKNRTKGKVVNLEDENIFPLKVKEMIFNIYKEDFEYFGYEK